MENGSDKKKVGLLDRAMRGGKGSTIFFVRV